MTGKLEYFEFGRRGRGAQRCEVKDINSVEDCATHTHATHKAVKEKERHCVCVCVCEREKDRESGIKRRLNLIEYIKGKSQYIPHT